jgi:hypothetical protein
MLFSIWKSAEGFTVPTFVDQSSAKVSSLDVEIWVIVIALLALVVVTLLGRWLYRLLFK